MADKDQNPQSEPADLALARAVRELDRDIQPQRDLWPAIERNLVAHPQRDSADIAQRWVPWGVAASLLIATAALVLGIVRTVEVPLATASPTSPAARIQDAYVSVRNPMMEKFSRANRSLDPVTLDDLYRNFEILENARREIERELRAHPHDRHLMQLLMRVHEQEVEILKRNYTEPGRTM